ncbi:MAG: Exopolyphosphatase [Owenweeksia sp. TMED14]|nr:MAG: Exopolyphosphatase [Owenweeksia sp. TMED14]
MKITRIAAIDIGSNSLRLLITNVIYTKKYTHYKKVSITRLPVRLGEDVFSTGEISKKSGLRLVDSMRAFAAIMRVNDIDGYRACATSAMRESTNGNHWLKEIKNETDIDIEIIDGHEEAHLVFNAKLFDKIQPKEKNLLFVDVGGGSTEFTLFQDDELVLSKSFKIGTVRILLDLDQSENWSNLKTWISNQVNVLNDRVAIIGSGGNINKVHKMSNKSIDEPLSINYVNHIYNTINKMKLDDRITSLGLNIDRADVIVPALEIFQKILSLTGANKVYVPKVGLSDGIVRELYRSKFKPLLEL